MAHAKEHCQRPWWKRPPFWFIGIVAVALLVVAVAERTGTQAETQYGTFLDQVEAGNVASVSFEGMAIVGRYKHPSDGTLPAGAAQTDSFRSRVPDFGDSTLIPALRKQHVAIEITAPSAWSWLLGHVPWPMLIFVGAILVLGLVRLVRGGAAQPGTAAPALPAHGMMGLVSGLFAKQRPADSPSGPDGDRTKNP
jgi:ATP-dependent Zn protease